MKILFHISSLGKGGAERVISNLSNFLINNNEVAILTNSSNVIAYELNKNVKIFELDNDVKINNSLIRNLFRINETQKILKKYKPDIIITFLPLPSFRILFLKKRIKCKVIVSDRNNPEEEYKDKISNLLMRWLYKRADGFIFQTKDQQLYFSDIIRKKSIIIPNPIKEEFCEISKKIEKEDVIINVGRLHSQKNQILLIRAFNIIKDKYPSYVLKIFGKGELENELFSLINDLNLQDRVLLCGVSNNIKEELLKTKLFVLTSNFEGMPNSLLEAMACGVACISTDCPCGGPKEVIVNGKNGFLVPVNDPIALAECMDNLLANEEQLKMIGLNARKISNNLNPRIINRKWEKYIKEVLESKE